MNPLTTPDEPSLPTSRDIQAAVADLETALNALPPTATTESSLTERAAGLRSSYRRTHRDRLRRQHPAFFPSDSPPGPDDAHDS